MTYIPPMLDRARSLLADDFHAFFLVCSGSAQTCIGPRVTRAETMGDCDKDMHCHAV